MTVLPIIANNLGKIAATAAVTTLGVVGYVNRERLICWFTDEESDSEKQERAHGSKGCLRRPNCSNRTRARWL